MRLQGLKRQLVTKVDPRVTLDMARDLTRQAKAKLENANFFHAAGTALVAFNLAHLSALGAAKRGMKSLEKQAFDQAEKAEDILNNARKMVSKLKTPDMSLKDVFLLSQAAKRLSPKAMVLPVTFSLGKKKVTAPSIYDTGASITTIPMSLVQHLRVPKKGLIPDRTAIGVGGRVTAFMTRIDNMDIMTSNGAVPTGPIMVGVIRGNIPPLIGMDLMSKMEFLLDLRRTHFQIHARRSL